MSFSGWSIVPSMDPFNHFTTLIKSVTIIYHGSVKSKDHTQAGDTVHLRRVSWEDNRWRAVNRIFGWTKKILFPNNPSDVWRWEQSERGRQNITQGEAEMIHPSIYNSELSFFCRPSSVSFRREGFGSADWRQIIRLLLWNWRYSVKGWLRWV